MKLNFIEPESNYVIIGDRRQLISAVHALLENAVVYSPRGGTVSISIDRIDATTDEEGVTIGPLVHIAIKDEGVGIPAKDLERIFERFYRVDPGRARETGGTGLGLSIVRHVAQNHGGTVLVESREGEGSTFTPRAPDKPPMSKKLSERPARSVSWSSRTRSRSSTPSRSGSTARDSTSPSPATVKRPSRCSRRYSFDIDPARPDAAEDVGAGRLPIDPLHQRRTDHHRECQG